MVKAEKIILVPETHWDREWYLPFQEFRAELVLMFDKLLEILKLIQITIILHLMGK
jgi:alpha-mannosidase